MFTNYHALLKLYRKPKKCLTLSFRSKRKRSKYLQQRKIMIWQFFKLTTNGDLCVLFNGPNVNFLGCYVNTASGVWNIVMMYTGWHVCFGDAAFLKDSIYTVHILYICIYGTNYSYAYTVSVWYIVHFVQEGT